MLNEGQNFITACGAKLPLRLSVSNERSGEAEVFLVERPWALIGGDANCDIRLLHPDVSRRHACLQFVDSRILCCDLGSRTGTHAATEIRARCWLDAGDAIYVGPYSIRLVENDFASGAAGGPAAGPAESPARPAAVDLPLSGQAQAHLEFVNARNRAGGRRIRRIKRRVTLIGWSQSCNVHLRHSSVGRVHCSLVRTPAGLWVVDLLCQGGTQVNGRSVEFARLEEGDEISVGRFQMRVSYASLAEVAADSVAARDRVGVPAIDQSRGNRDGGLPSVEQPQTAGGIGFPVIAAAFPLTGPVPLFAPPTGLIGFRPAPLALPPNHSLTDSVAQSLLQQFSAMQQQLFDHTQQMLAAMAQTFNAAHTRQLDLIRDELFRVHEVNRELQDLNRELTRRREEHPEIEMPPLPGVPRRALREATKETVPDQPFLSLDGPPLAVPRSGAGRPRSDEPKPPIAGEGRGDLPGAGSPVTEPAAAGIDRLQALLGERINELENERSTRWQKILRILTPADGDEAD